MLNELVARAIVAERTEAALRAAQQRQWIVADRCPRQRSRRPRISGRSIWPVRDRRSRTAAAG
jgi:hypothetical protein